MKEQVCRTCRFTTTQPGFTSMYRLGYRNCEHKPVYMYVPGHATCEKWEKKA